LASMSAAAVVFPPLVGALCIVWTTNDWGYPRRQSIVFERCNQRVDQWSALTERETVGP
jgi:hypothetical protein